MPPAYLEGRRGRLSRSDENAGRIHYRGLDDEGRGQVLVAARQDGPHEPLDNGQVPHIVKPERAERVDQRVAQVEQAGKVIAHLLQALPQQGQAVRVGQPPDRLDALEPAADRLDAGHADPDGPGHVLDPRWHVRPAVHQVEPLLEDQPQELLEDGYGLRDDGRLYDGVARPRANLQIRQAYEHVEHAHADHRQRDRVPWHAHVAPARLFLCGCTRQRNLRYQALIQLIRACERLNGRDRAAWRGAFGMRSEYEARAHRRGRRGALGAPRPRRDPLGPPAASHAGRLAPCGAIGASGAARQRRPGTGRPADLPDEGKEQ